ncbi:MAG: winged helix-turn-helix transcriptional regulator [Nanoarchaeota archaeon]|nr:winged helix-turn-helix transcriptional regulator [Nanoarchaeota archaeon]
MDKTYKKLLYELHWNARQTYSQLAKKIGVSKQVARYRAEQLAKNGVLKSTHAVIDWRKLGYDALRIYVKWQNISPETEKEIYAFLREDPLFMWTVKFEGEIDIAFYVWVKEIPEFSKRWFSFLARYRKHILRYEVYESVEMIHYPMKFLVEKPSRAELVIGRGGKADYDAKDYEVLRALTEDARMPVTAIAKRVGLTPKGAIYRIRQLEQEGIVIGYYALIDAEKIGVEFYKIDFYLNDLSRLSEMEEYAKQHKNVVYRMRTIGGPDLEIEIAVANASEMKKVTEEFRKRFPREIHSSRFHRFEYTLKQIYLPGETVTSSARK